MVIFHEKVDLVIQLLLIFVFFFIVGFLILSPFVQSCKGLVDNCFSLPLQLPLRFLHERWSDVQWRHFRIDDDLLPVVAPRFSRDGSLS